MAIKLVLILLAVLATNALSQVDEDCVAEAVAQTTSTTAVAEAVSGTVSQTFTSTVVCGDSVKTDPNSVGGLSFAVAVAISEAEEVEEKCVANAEAQAEAGNFTSDFVTGVISDTLLGEVEGDEETLARAWLEAQNTAMQELVKEAQNNDVGKIARDGCVDISALQNGLPTATELGDALADAIGQIFQAVTCGDNLEPSEEPCTWADEKFKGQCLGVQPVSEAPSVSSPEANPATASVEETTEQTAEPTPFVITLETNSPAAPVEEATERDATAIPPVPSAGNNPPNSPVDGHAPSAVSTPGSCLEQFLGCTETDEESKSCRSKRTKCEKDETTSTGY